MSVHQLKNVCDIWQSNQNSMKKLIPFLFLPFLISCVSQKKYAALEDKCSLSADFSEKLDLILSQLRENDNSIMEEEMNLRIDMMKIELSALKSLNQMQEEGLLSGASPDEIRDNLRQMFYETMDHENPENQDQYNPTDENRSKIAVQAIAMLLDQRLTKNHPEVIAKSNEYSCEISIPKSSLTSGGSILSPGGKDILSKTRGVINILDNYTIEIRTKTKNKTISSSDVNLANSVSEFILNIKGNTKPTLQSSFEFNSDQINSNTESIQILIYKSLPH